jgi:hypothetical protein
MASSTGGSSTGDYRVFERGTPAGNILHKLYTKRTCESTLDPELLKKLERYRKQKAEEVAPPKPKVVPKSQAHVDIPMYSVYGGRGKEMVDDRGLQIMYSAPSTMARVSSKPHRRTESAIRRAEARAPVQEPPAPARPAITDKDKTRLQQICEFGAPLPGPGASAQLRLPPVTPRERERTLKKKRFDEVRAEVGARRAFLQSLDEEGTAKAAEKRARKHQVTLELQDLLAEMKEIDEWLRRRDAEDIAEAEDDEAEDEFHNDA